MSEDNTQLSDWETFHDALDYPEQSSADDMKQGFTLQTRESKDPTGGGTSASTGSGSISSGTKRQHWEISASGRLLQQREPSSPSKRIALTSSSSSSSSSSTTTTKDIVFTGLLKPRSFTPRPSLSATCSAPIVLGRSSSVTPDSLVPATSRPGTLWSRQNWSHLETLFHEMNGNALEENDLSKIAVRFLEEQRTRTGQMPPWTRDMVQTRCMALHRVQRSRNQQNSRVPQRHLRASRNSADPYPTRSLHGNSVLFSTATGTTSNTVTDFVDRRRSERSERQREVDQGYQLKTVFKHRFASGLRTVGQLLPFWRDVEKGNMDVEEKMAVPLVPAGRAQSVIEAFESHSEELLSRTGSLPSRAGSVLSTTSSPAASSIAEMIARGHSARTTSAMPEQSA
ncbi:hypothetical protein BGX28_009164 [Mortierella sp. GBA30]|nr:hypothetical protein BGX28_009164 [Mortierella sp. GBA30]